MEYEWRGVDGFPDYLISTNGEIYCQRTDKEVRPSNTNRGALKVNLVRDGKQHTRTLPILVATAFVEGQSEKNDTPVQKDGDRNNVCATNFMWMPRWFAWKYSHQFVDIEEKHYKGPIVCLNTKIEYPTVVEAGIHNGVLFNDIWRSIHFRVHTYPHGLEFRHARAADW